MMLLLPYWLLAGWLWQIIIQGGNWTWLLALASIIGVIANIYKKQWCFAIWLFTNATWTLVDFMAGIYAQSALFAVYTGLAVWGLWKWRKADERFRSEPCRHHLIGVGEEHFCLRLHYGKTCSRPTIFCEYKIQEYRYRRLCMETPE